MERFSADQLQTWVSEARERWHVPGMALGVSAGGATTFAADGVCELGRDERVTAETAFRIASITKPFVGTLAMTLVQEGQLALDEPPPGARTTASIRQLLSHQAGLAAEWPRGLDDDADDEALLRLAEREPALLPVGPGELFSYCNTGYWFVGAGIARVCGTSFEEAMRQRVLEPLALASTSFEPARAARGHEQVTPGADEHEPADAAYPRVRRPSGGLWSTVGDLLRFGEHHLGEPGPLTQESVAELQRPLVPLPGGSYGLCWFLPTDRPRRTIEHPGSAVGFQSLLLLVPEERVAFAALTSSSRGLRAIEDVLGRLGLGRVRSAEVELAPEALDSFAGTYEGQGTRLEIRRDGGGLEVAATEVDPFRRVELAYPPMPARPVGEREFVVTEGEWRGDRFDFPRDGFVRLLTLAARVE